METSCPVCQAVVATLWIRHISVSELCHINIVIFAMLLDLFTYLGSSVYQANLTFI